MEYDQPCARKFEHLNSCDMPALQKRIKQIFHVSGGQGSVCVTSLCRLSKRQVKLMRESGVPMQMINGRNDLVAGVCWVKKLAKQLKCPLILTGTPICP